MHDYWYDKIDSLITEATECIDEIIRKKVIRGKKAVIKKFCKLATQKNVGGKCVARSSKERIRKSRAMKKAARRKKFSKIITFTGIDKNNPVAKLGDINFWINSKAYNYIENIHQIWLLTIVDLIIGKSEYPPN